jgi:pimeloyl-ACP methyl ester carboxylesterase
VTVRGRLLIPILVLLSACAKPLPVPPADLRGMQMHRIEEPVFGGRAYVYEAGTQHPRSIVLVHGIGDGPADFAPHIEWLAQSYHVVTFDLPGFGRSDKANAIYSPTNYAAFIKHVADRFVRRPFVLLGHSMGGVAALRYATLYRADLTQLVVVDVPGILHRYLMASQALGRLESGFLPSFMDPLERFAQIARKVLMRIEGSGYDPQSVLADAALRDRYLSAEPARIAALGVALEDFSRELPSLTVETLIVWGRDDDVAPLRNGRLLAGVMPRSHLAVIERAGHVPMLEAPDTFRAVLDRFLRDGLPAAVNSPARVRHGDVRCSGRQHLVYEGDYDKLTLNDCRDVRIRRARIRELVVIDSSVAIDDSHIGGDMGLFARNASVTMTNGRIEGESAITAIASRLDLAGVTLEARSTLMRAPETSYVVFSLARALSPALKGPLHQFITVTPDRPL